MKHKHYDLILAWANDTSLKLQCRAPIAGKLDNAWTDMKGETPAWCNSLEYRIKPKPPIVRYAVAPRPAIDGLNQNGFQSFPLQYTSIQTPHDNIKLTFDGNTLKLLSVEKI